MSYSPKTIALTALSIAAIGVAVAVGLSTFGLSSMDVPWLKPGTITWWLATIILTTSWYCLHKGYFACVVDVYRSLRSSLSRYLPMVIVVIGVVIGLTESARADEKEKKPTLLETLKGINEGLRTVTEKGNEVRGALENGMVPVHSDVTHQLYRAPFYVKRGQVTVYVGPLCEPCTAAVQYLKDERIAHRVRDVTTSTAGKREYSKLGSSGVPILLFLGRRMDGFTESDFDCARNTPKDQEADCVFEELSAPEDAATNDEDQNE